MPTMEPKTRKPRPQSARLDVLAMMMAGGSSNNSKQRPTSPADSMSPCRDDFARTPTRKDINTARTPTRQDSARDFSTKSKGPDDDDWFASEPACPPLSGKWQAHEAGTTPSVQTTTITYTQQALPSHVPSSKHRASAAASLSSYEPRCLLSRPHRPTTISVDDTNGASTLTAYELKQAILETRLVNDPLQPLARTLPLSLPERGRTRHRRSPAQQIDLSAAIMGNQHSHHDTAYDGAFDHPDDRSTHSVLRASRQKAARLPRRSSMHLFKRLDSKSPLPADLSGTVIEVPRAATAPNLDGMVDDDETEDGEQERSRAKHAHRHSAPSPALPRQPASPTETVTEESAGRPLSASSTITDQRPNTNNNNFVEEDSPAYLRVSALSPTLPAPSPIPEDSPHKYGLRDHMDTPEANSPPPADAELSKARRRHSGLAIFHVSLRSLPDVSIEHDSNTYSRKPKICNPPLHFSTA